MKLHNRIPVKHLSLLVILLLMQTKVYSSGLLLNYEDVTEIEINQLFSESIVNSYNHVTNQEERLEFYNDGNVILKTNKTRQRGLWYTDGTGRHCIKWSQSDTSSCAVIMRDDGNWVKVKNDEIIKSYKKIEALDN